MAKYCINTVFLVILPLLLFFSSMATAAEPLYFKPGQSRTLRVKERIDTVFISDPSVVDYKIINSNSVVLYAKTTGIAELTIYGDNAKILQYVRIDSDPFIRDISQRLAKEFPGNQISVKRFMNGDKIAYILTGDVTDEETRDAVYQMVSSLVGIDGKERQIKYSGNGDERVFLSQKIYYNVINRLQLPSSNQVNVKLTVVEVSKEFTDSLGIEWSSLTLKSIIEGGSSTNAPGAFNLLGFRRGFDAANISTFINAIKNDSIARVLAQPNLTVLSGESANFLVGGEIPILVRHDDSTSVQYKEYGIRLNIAAKVEKRKKIRLFVANELSSVSGTYAYNDYQIPTIRTRRSSSTIELADGDSFIISGLLSETDRESLSKIPFIGDIPVLGALARSSHTERNKTELVVFATVNLVKPLSTSSTNSISLPEYRRSSVERLFFNMGVDRHTREGRLSSDASDFIFQGGFDK